jgi:uncharacterized protein (DUF58 family)
MVPARRVYWLLILGLMVAPVMAIALPGEMALPIAGVGLAGFDLLVVALALVDGIRGQEGRVRVRRDPIERLSIGRDNSITLTVQAKQRPAEVQVRDGYPLDMGATPATLNLTLAPQESQQLTYTVYPTHRGEYQWGHIQIRQLGPWGLVWSNWKQEQPQTVTVYPDLIGLKELSIRLTLQSAGSIRRAKQRGIGTEFTELRDYATGDDPRLIDWKATARRNRPLVRVLEPEQEQTLIILLDRGRLMTAQVQELQRFDWGLNATLALAMAGLNRGDRVGVAVFDRQIHTWVPPERGHLQLTRLLERLSPIQPDLLEPDYFGTVTTIVNQQARRALVVMLTDIVDATASAELLAALGRLAPRYLPFCVTLRDPEVDRIAHTVTDDLDSTYARAVALDLLNQRQEAFALLKQRGALVLDAPADQISDQLVEQYLRLKAQSRL